MPNKITKKRRAEMIKYSDLRNEMIGYEDIYFQDMSFQKKSILNRIARNDYSSDSNNREEIEINDEWILQLRIKNWLIVYSGEEYKLLKDVLGLTIYKEKIIIIRNLENKQERKNIIIHEMIHAYIMTIDKLLEKNKSLFLLLYLYDSVCKKIGRKKVWKFIDIENHMTDERVETSDHTLLFLLKSLELDLRLKLELGTIYHYGRKELFHSVSSHITKT